MADDPKTTAETAAETALVFTQEAADRVYNELREMSVDLDADPLSFGPKRLNGKVSEVRRQLDRCERIFLDIAQQLHTTKRQLRIETTVLEIEKKNLFANDPETRAGRSISDREAIATGKLRAKVEHMNKINLSVQDLEAVLLVVKAKRTDLKDIQGRLRDQIGLCREELGLGTPWGTKRPNAPELNLPPAAVTAGIDHVDSLLREVEGEMHLKDWETVKFEPHEKASDAAPEVPPAPEAGGQKGEEVPAAVLPEEGNLSPLAFPGSASQEAVDDFLKGMPDLSGKASQKGGSVPVEDDGSLDSILDAFEKP